MASIRDVAEHAGVSIATVSHVLNDTRPVSAATTGRVNAAVEALGYRPNRVAKSLRTSRSTTIGMLVPDNANPFFAEMARGVEHAAFDRGYNVMLCNTEGDADKERRYGDALIENRIAGVVLITADRTSRLVDDLHAAGVPVVVLDRDLDRVDVDAVLPRHHDGAVAATEHLVGVGHRRIGCIASETGGTAATERLRGFREAIEEAGVESVLAFGDFQYEGGHQAARELLAAPDSPTAIFACNDLMAIGALRAAQELGLAVPNDVSIVGFDDVAQASYTAPALTTVAQPTERIGAIATELLLRRIDDPTATPDQRYVDTELVVRESVAEPGGRS